MTDGTRTHDNQNHNLGLYQLSYGHHAELLLLTYPPLQRRVTAQTPYPFGLGLPGGNRTPDPQLRRLLLYPTELPADAAGAAFVSPVGQQHPTQQIQLWSGWRDSNSRPSAPKADALPGCATPRETGSIAQGPLSPPLYPCPIACQAPATQRQP